MALIKRSETDNSVHRKVALDLGDMARRAELMRETATTEAERIIAEAHAERRRILEGAAAAGREQGLAEGREAGLERGRAEGREEAIREYRERLAAFDASSAAMMEEFRGSRDALLTEARQAAIELAVAIAERVVHRKIGLDPSVVVDQMRELLALVASPSTLVVRVHPDDEELLLGALPGLCERLVDGVHVQLSRDPELARGSCVARSLGGASIDASIDVQIERVVRDLLPGEPEAAA